MALIVQKFGGTSVATTERIKNVAKRIARWKARGNDIIVVPSAMSGETNRLIALAKEISPKPDPRELDVIAATGEQVMHLVAVLVAENIEDQMGPRVGLRPDVVVAVADPSRENVAGRGPHCATSSTRRYPRDDKFPLVRYAGP